VAADPYRWQRSLEVLDGDGIPVSEFFQNAARTGPATVRAYQLIVDQVLTHDGDPRLARHVANAILKADSRGARLAKEHKDSPRRIDAAVCMVMAVHRAAELADTTRPSTPSGGRCSFRLQGFRWPIGSMLGAKQSTRGHRGGAWSPRGAAASRISSAAPSTIPRTGTCWRHRWRVTACKRRAGGSRRGGQAGAARTTGPVQ